MSNESLAEVFQLVEQFYLKKVGYLSSPKDSVLFLIQELGELSDAITRENPDWNRNNERTMNVGEELADILMLVLVVANHYKVEPLDILRQKMIRKLEALNE